MRESYCPQVHLQLQLLLQMAVLVPLALLVMHLPVRVLLAERSVMHPANSSDAGYPLAVVIICMSEGSDE